MKIIVFLLFLSIYFIPNIEIKRIIIEVISYAWFLATILYIIYIYKDKDKEYEYNYKSEYCEQIPMNRSPEVLGYLMEYSVKKEHFIATLMDLIRKKSILIGKFENDNEQILIDNKKNNEFLSKSEEFIKKWLFSIIGNGEYVTYNQIKKESKNNSGYFFSCYLEYTEIATFECAKYDFFENKKNFLEKVFFYFIISYIFSGYNIFLINNYTLGLLIFIVNTIFIIYVNYFYRRTQEANREYKEWLAFKKYIKKPDNNLHEYDIETLGLITVYSKVLNSFEEIKLILNKTNKVDENNFLYSVKANEIDQLIVLFNTTIENTKMKKVFFSRNNGSLTARRLKNDRKIIILSNKGEYYDRENN